jgi:diacylglycerol kinase (ATP)
MNRVVAVIVNPASGRGRGRRRLEAVRRAFEHIGARWIECTRHAGDERHLTERALNAGATTIVAVGGDGTWSNVADAMLTSGAGECRLALVAAGTGNDFAKTIGAPAADLQRTAQLVADGSDMRVDVGRIEDRHFLNIAGFGFDTAVLEESLRSSVLRGRALYISAALRQLMRYRGIHISVGTNGDRWEAHHLMLIVANAKHFGGSFRIAPEASPQDGLLDAISVLDAPVLRRLALFRAVIAGTHMRLPEVRARRASTICLRFHTPPAFEADGEYRLASTTDIEISCLPSALRVVTG